MKSKINLKRKFQLLEDTLKNLPQETYYGADKIYKIVKSKGVQNIGKSTIRRWLQNQDWYSLHKPARLNFRRARVRVSSIDEQFDADLADMTSISRYNKGVKYLLVVIDIFSRYLWVESLKNKTTKEVVNGFKKIFKKGRKCSKLRTDKGTEFIGK